MKTPSMRQAGLAALLTCGLVLFVPGNTFAQGRGHRHGGDRGDRGGPDGQNAPGANQGQGAPGGPGGVQPAGGPGTRDPGVKQREHNQEQRIQQGVQSGQLTKGEAQNLQSEEKAIHQEEKQYKSDGVLTKDERKDLHQDLNQASKDIYQDKHNADTQPGVTPAQPGTGAPGTRDPGVNQRQANQERRIQQGVQSGELTKREARTLEEKEAHLATMEKRLKSDGSLSAEDRARLQRRLDWLSKDIARQKHDGQTQPPAPTP